MLKHIGRQVVVEHTAADHGVIAIGTDAVGHLFVGHDPAHAGRRRRIGLRQRVGDNGPLVHVDHRHKGLSVFERQIHLVAQRVGAHRTGDLGNLAEHIGIEHRTDGVRCVVYADKLGVGAHKALEFLDIGLPAEFLAKLPILDLGAERTRDLIERRIGGPLGNHMVAGLDHGHDGVEVRTRAAIGLQNVVGIDLATIQLGDLDLKLQRTLDPAVVHLLAVQALVERGTILIVERAKLAHGKRRNRRLGDIPRSALLPNVKPFLNADCLDIHGQAPYKSSHPIVLTFLIQDWGGANIRTAPMGDI